VFTATPGVVDTGLQPLGQYQWPVVALVVSTVLSGFVWAGLHRWIPGRIRNAGFPGVFVIFGQTLDGVTTIIGIDLLGFTEQVPLSRLVLELASGLPTADILGTAWLLFLLKIGLAVLLVSLVRPDADGPADFTSLALVGAGIAGLWPGINNLVLQMAL
jgi:uncharacterized membrane protein